MEQADQLAALLQGDPVKSIGCLSQWVKYVNTAATKRELHRLAISTVRGRPFGAESWVARIVGHLGLEHTIRSEGRPLKATTAKVIT
jgi:hypothetical protein